MIRSLSIGRWLPSIPPIARKVGTTQEQKRKGPWWERKKSRARPHPKGRIPRQGANSHRGRVRAGGAGTLSDNTRRGLATLIVTAMFPQICQVSKTVSSEEIRASVISSLRSSGNGLKRSSTYCHFTSLKAQIPALPFTNPLYGEWGQSYYPPYNVWDVRVVSSEFLHGRHYANALRTITRFTKQWQRAAELRHIVIVTFSKHKKMPCRSWNLSTTPALEQMCTIVHPCFP